MHTQKEPRIQKSRKRTILYFFLLALFSLLFLFSSTMVVKNYLRGKQEQAIFDELSHLVEDNTTEEEEENYQKYQEIYNRNQDFVAWISIDNTKINYPIMQHETDEEYYLYRNFEKDYSPSGSLFLGKGGNLDSSCMIVYGHNMDNDTMFGTLDNYKNFDFWKKNKTFALKTTETSIEYEVFAAVNTQILYADEVGFRYYNSAGHLSEAEYTQLVDWLQTHALYDTDIQPHYEENIVILSTCSYHNKNGRFLVAARKTEE